MDGAEQVVGDDLWSRGDGVGRIGCTEGDAIKQTVSQALDVEGLMESVRRRGRDREQTLAEYQETAQNVKAKSDQEGEIGPSKAALPIGHPRQPVTETVPTMGGWIRHAYR